MAKSKSVHGQDERARRTPEAYADAALTLICEQGLENFSTRKLGATLGVEAMAIYHHFPSKAVLLDAVAERLLLLAPPPTSPPEDWKNWMRELGRGYYGLAKSHPRAFQLLAARRFATAGAFAWFERTLSVLSLAGLPPQERAKVFRALGAVVNGAGMAYIATLEMAEGPNGNFEAMADRFPQVSAVAEFLNIDHQDELFSFTLDAMIKALEPIFSRYQ